MADPRLIGGWFPRPAGPRAVWEDLRGLFSAKGRHKLVFLTISIGITSTIMTGFIVESRDRSLLPGPQTIYVSDWHADRTDAEIKAQQKIDMKELKEAREERRRQFQKLDDALKRLGI
jgi:hypothetical protein